jgi:hypothetical protein
MTDLMLQLGKSGFLPGSLKYSGGHRAGLKKRGVYQGEGPEERQTGLCSDEVARGKGWHSGEIKPKESKHEEGLSTRGRRALALG